MLELQISDLFRDPLLRGFVDRRDPTALDLLNACPDGALVVFTGVFLVLDLLFLRFFAFFSFLSTDDRELIRSQKS